MCDAEVALPARLVGVVPSPQSIEIDETIPSGSAVEKVRVTSWPVAAGLGDALVMLTVGGLSLIAIVPVAEPVEPPLSVLVIVMVKV